MRCSGNMMKTWTSASRGKAYVWYRRTTLIEHEMEGRSTHGQPHNANANASSTSDSEANEKDLVMEPGAVEA